MRDDFLAKLDTKLAKQQATTEQRQETGNAARDFAVSVMPEAIALANEYKAALAARGITLDVQGSAISVRLSMRYQDGDHHDVMVAYDPDGARMRVTGFHSENGKRYTSDPVKSWTEETWSLREFEQVVEKHIDDYIDYAPRHRGTV